MLRPDDARAIVARKVLTNWLKQADQVEALSKFDSPSPNSISFRSSNDDILIYNGGINATITKSGFVVDYSYIKSSKPGCENHPVSLDDANAIAVKSIELHQNESWRIEVHAKTTQPEGRFEFVGRYELKERPGVARTRITPVRITIDVQRGRIARFRGSIPPPAVAEKLGPFLNEEVLWKQARTVYLENSPYAASSTGSPGFVYRSIPNSRQIVWFTKERQNAGEDRRVGAFYEAIFTQINSNALSQQVVWLDARTGSPIAHQSTYVPNISSAAYRPPPVSAGSTGVPILAWKDRIGRTRVALQLLSKQIFLSTFDLASGKLTSDWGPNHEWQATDRQIWEILKLLRAK